MLLILDGNYIVNRAYYGNKANLTAPNGQRMNGVMGFFKTLSHLLSNPMIDHLFVAWDINHKYTWRFKLLQEHALRYKGVRETDDEKKLLIAKDIHQQILVVRKILRRYGILQRLSPRYLGDEADDLIASVAVYTKLVCHIATSDKDLLQLVNDRVSILRETKTLITPNNISTILGVSADKIVDYLCLYGDSIDSVPGIYGCGHKTAIELLKKYGTIENVVKHKKEITGKVGKTLRNKDHLPIEVLKKLISLNTECYNDYDDTMSLIKPNYDKINLIKKEYNIKSILIGKFGI